MTADNSNWNEIFNHKFSCDFSLISAIYSNLNIHYMQKVLILANFRAIIFYSFRRGIRQGYFHEHNSLHSNIDKATSYSTVINWYNEFSRRQYSLQKHMPLRSPKICCFARQYRCCAWSNKARLLYNISWGWGIFRQ